MKALRDLPNQNGFRFIGVFLDGREEPCVVEQDEDSETHYVVRERDAKPCFFMLYAWKHRHPDPTNEPRADSRVIGLSVREYPDSQRIAFGVWVGQFVMLWPKRGPDQPGESRG